MKIAICDDEQADRKWCLCDRGYAAVSKLRKSEEHGTV